MVTAPCVAQLVIAHYWWVVVVELYCDCRYPSALIVGYLRWLDLWCITYIYLFDWLLIVDLVSDLVIGLSWIVRT